MRALSIGARGVLRVVRRAGRWAMAARRAVPSAIIIGAQRAGTTSLFHYLAAHPQVRAPAIKEVHFFDLGFDRGMRWYRSHFPPRDQVEATGKMTFEASPYYMFHPAVPERIARVLPEARLIALLRNPIDRAASQYRHNLKRGCEPLSFAHAIAAEAGRLAGEEARLRGKPDYVSDRHRQYSYAGRGQYAEQLERWLARFPRQQLLVIQSEEMFARPAAVYARVLAFLGLPDHRLTAFDQKNRTASEEPLDPALRQALARHFEPHNRRLFDLLGTSFDWT